MYLKIDRIPLECLTLREVRSVATSHEDDGGVMQAVSLMLRA